MSKTPVLKNLNFKIIYNESLKFNIPVDNSYISTYPEFISYFQDINELTKHDLIIASHFVYGWMPTIINLKLDEIDKVLKYLNNAKNGYILKAIELELLKKCINNSLVGVSKLLHFINPVDYAIWDSRIYRFTTSKKSSYGIGNVMLYIDYLSKLNKIELHPNFYLINNKISSIFNYHMTPKRIIELIMFEADKKQQLSDL